MALRVLALCCTCAFALLAGYSAAFFAWVSATPLSADQYRRVQYNQYAWLFLFMLAAGASVFLVINTIVYARRRKEKGAQRRGFEVLHD